MPRWKEGTTEFVVSLNPTSGTHGCKIPKPIVEMLGNPEKLRFVVRGRNVMVRAGEA